MASLLIGLYSAHDYEGDYLHLLMGWFDSQFGEDSASVSIFASVSISSVDRNKD